MGTAERAATGANGRKPRMRFWAGILFSAGFSAILAMLVLEGAVRLLWPQRPYEDWVAPDARYGHLYKANQHSQYPFPGSDFVMDLRINSLGFRDDEPDPPVAGGKTVLFVGDSYTMGFALDLESRFDRRLARLFKENGREFRFINTGVDGWGTVQETRYAEDHFDTLRPDIVVLTFCENDAYDDATFLARGGPTPVETRPVRLFLQTHSHLYRFAYGLQWMWQHRNEVKELGRSQKPDGVTDPADAITIPEDLWRQSLQRLREFHASLLKYNPNAVLIVQATSPTSADVRAHLSSLDNGTSLCYVDLGGPVSALPVKERRLPHDPHWSARVHELSARALYERIAKLPPTLGNAQK